MRPAHENFVSAALYHARTLLLFTSDQLFDTVIPGTCFGVLAALSGPALELNIQDTFIVLQRTPLVACWLWLLILQACVQNQCAAGSEEEDAINKPWRPIPSKRITQAQAQKLLIAATIMSGIASGYFRVFSVFVVYTLLLALYNNFGGGDHSGVVRNLLCALGFSCYFGGALSIATGRDQNISRSAYHWTFLVTLGIFATTIHTQEFRDEEGDRARGRSTLVTLLGRKIALWTIIVMVPFWSLLVPLVFFSGTWTLAILPTVSGSNLVTAAFKALSTESPTYDRRMYTFWCLWLCSFFPLPVLEATLIQEG